MRAQVKRQGRLPKIALVAGLDAHYQPGARRVWGCAVLLTWPGLDLVESALASRPLDFPYVPGLLSFREAPALLAALACLSRRPGLLFVDGQGIAHPRRFGLASHVGVEAGIPAIGVAKSRLVGHYEDPPREKGGRSPLRDGTQIVGVVLRSRSGVRPVFVSVGHRIGLDAAVDFVLAAATRYRLPEPTRLADKLSRMHPR
jgi:deoxyribonuclease V